MPRGPASYRQARKQAGQGQNALVNRISPPRQQDTPWQPRHRQTVTRNTPAPNAGCIQSKANEHSNPPPQHPLPTRSSANNKKKKHTKKKTTKNRMPNNTHLGACVDDNHVGIGPVGYPILFVFPQHTTSWVKTQVDPAIFPPSASNFSLHCSHNQNLWSEPSLSYLGAVENVVTVIALTTGLALQVHDIGTGPWTSQSSQQRVSTKKGRYGWQTSKERHRDTQGLNHRRGPVSLMARAPT